MTVREDLGEIRSAHSNAYNIFILVLTIGSLAIMALLLLPLDQQTLDLLRAYDNMICLVFLADFAGNLLASKPRERYFIRDRGWLDLIGSVPSFGFFPAAGLLRLARLSRLARIGRILGGSNRKALIHDVITNRSSYAVVITLLSALVVLGSASVLVLQFESKSPDANIETGGDALWWGLVTITTVGYGDFYPVTALGRLTGVFVMFAGIGIIGALASILASLLVASPEPEPDAPQDAAEAPEPASVARSLDAVTTQLADLQAEVLSLRAALQDSKA